MSDGAENDATGIDVKSFEAMDASKELQAYINILDVFDGLSGIQALKKAAIARCQIREGMSILDAGCGTGLETVRLARLVGSSGNVIGLDASRNLLAEASRRAQGSRLPIEYREGDIHQLPFPDNYFVSLEPSDSFSTLPIRAKPLPSLSASRRVMAQSMSSSQTLKRRP